MGYLKSVFQEGSGEGIKEPHGKTEEKTLGIKKGGWGSRSQVILVSRGGLGNKRPEDPHEFFQRRIGAGETQGGKTKSEKGKTEHIYHREDKKMWASKRVDKN